VVGSDQLIPPGHRCFNASLPLRKFDLDRARFYMQKAGAVGPALPPIYATTDLNGSIEMAELMQQTAAKIGVSLTVNRVPGDGQRSRGTSQRDGFAIFLALPS
jgi:peptide/nickel transport system substrate-binding protein